MRCIALIMACFAFSACAHATIAPTNADVTLKEIFVHFFEGDSDVLTLSEKNARKACVLRNSEKSYVIIYSDEIPDKKILWQATVLGKAGNDLVAFITISWVTENNAVMTKSIAVLWDDNRWQKDETAGSEKVAAFIQRHFAIEESEKLFNCALENDNKKENGNKKTDPLREAAVTFTARLHYITPHTSAEYFFNLPVSVPLLRQTNPYFEYRKPTRRSPLPPRS